MYAKKNDFLNTVGDFPLAMFVFPTIQRERNNMSVSL